VRDFLLVMAPGVGVYLFSLGVGIAMGRWAETAGLEGTERVSNGRMAVALACIILGATFGAALATIHVALLALTVPVAVIGLIAGIQILRRGKEPARASRPHRGPRHAGLAYFWFCWVPLRVHDFGRAMLAALMAPPLAILFAIFEKWWPAAIFGGLSVLAWVVVVTVKPRSAPQRGPCLPAE
jgi:hypothetical protein